MAEKRSYHLSDAYPNQGGSGSAKEQGYEGDGAAGEKEPMPGPYASMASDDGYHDVAPQSEFARRHGLPAVSATPDVQGEVETSEPTKGEGATGPADYPNAGPPRGTTGVGVGGNSME